MVSAFVCSLLVVDAALVVGGVVVSVLGTGVRRRKALCLLVGSLKVPWSDMLVVCACVCGCVFADGGFGERVVVWWVGRWVESVRLVEAGEGAGAGRVWREAMEAPTDFYRVVVLSMFTKGRLWLIS